ncbi:sulfotransferase [Lentisalinibacter salinarum]|uniref:sulfotransferase n=1 Tax=Lentisalinibacter salinarum TaxID=2992239 RepID=UPI00386CD9FF
MLTRRQQVRKHLKKVFATFFVRESSPIPCFIFGEMRSGTNMLIGCLDRSFSVATYNENDVDAFNDFVLKETRELKQIVNAASAKIVAFKCIADSQRASELLLEFPTSRAIWIYRNYHDVVNSAIRKWTEHNAYLKYIIDESAAARWRGVNISEDTRSLIVEHYSRGISDESARALIWYFRNRFYYEQALDREERVKLVKYEDVTRTPDHEIRQLFDFLNLPYKARYVDAISTRSIGKDSVPQIDPAIEELCQGLYARLNDDASSGRLEKTARTA